MWPMIEAVRLSIKEAFSVQKQEVRARGAAAALHCGNLLLFYVLCK